MDYIYLFILLALFAEILGTVGGFGSSLFFVPIASYFLDFHSVLGITAVFHVSSNITKIYYFRDGYDKSLIIKIGIPAVVFVIIGAILSKYFKTEFLEMLMACFLIIISLTFLIFRNLIIKPSNFNSVTGGILSGIFAGLIGTGGAIRGMTLAAFNLSTAAFITTSAIIDLGIDASRSIVYILNGYLHTHDLYLVPILLLVSIAGTYIGKRILTHVSENQFKSMVLILVLLTGFITLFKAIKLYYTG